MPGVFLYSNVIRCKIEAARAPSWSGVQLSNSELYCVYLLRTYKRACMPCLPIPGLTYTISLCLLIASIMSHICTGCHVGYPSNKGLERHENVCSLKMEQQVVPQDAFLIYERKKERKRQRRLEQLTQQQTSSESRSSLPLLDLPYVCQNYCFS